MIFSEFRTTHFDQIHPPRSALTPPRCPLDSVPPFLVQTPSESNLCRPVTPQCVSIHGSVIDLTGGSILKDSSLPQKSSTFYNSSEVGPHEPLPTACSSVDGFDRSQRAAAAGSELVGATNGPVMSAVVSKRHCFVSVTSSSYRPFCSLLSDSP